MAQCKGCCRPGVMCGIVWHSVKGNIAYTCSNMCNNNIIIIVKLYFTLVL